jgi:NAD(P)H dehydrogenase (quinone)
MGRKRFRLFSPTAPTPRIVHVEGPRRYSVLDAAATLSKIVGREIVPRAIPEADWLPALTRGGLSPSYANLICEMYVAHNAGRIDVEPGIGEVRFGKTELSEVFSQLLARPAA